MSVSREVVEVVEFVEVVEVVLSNVESVYAKPHRARASRWPPTTSHLQQTVCSSTLPGYH